MSERAIDAPRHRWERFGLRWEYECRRPKGKRWGVSDGSRGCEQNRTPLAAYLALRRWRKVPARPWPDPRREGEGT